MSKKIVGVFKDEDSAIRAIRMLEYDGYLSEEISVIVKDRDQLEVIEGVTDVKPDNNRIPNTKSGAITGAAIGGLGTLLLEITTLAIPGVGPLIAAGPIVATLSGLVVGGAVGGLSGALIDVGFTLNEAKEYKAYLDEGNVVVFVDEKDNKDLVYRNFEENASIVSDKYPTNSHNKNEELINAKWHEFKGDPKARWGKLTESDLNIINGDPRKLSGRLQDRYGWTREQADREIDSYRR